MDHSYKLDKWDDVHVQTLNAQCVHPMLVKKTQAVTRVGLEPTTSYFSSADVLTTRPPNLPVATGWFEYIEQWVLQTIFQVCFFCRGDF